MRHRRSQAVEQFGPLWRLQVITLQVKLFQRSCFEVESSSNQRLVLRAAISLSHKASLFKHFSLRTRGGRLISKWPGEKSPYSLTKFCERSRSVKDSDQNKNACAICGGPFKLVKWHKPQPARSSLLKDPNAGWCRAMRNSTATFVSSRFSLGCY